MQIAQFNIDGHKILLDVSEKYSLDNHMDSLWSWRSHLKSPHPS